MTKSNIEWEAEMWNPITGGNKNSAGTLNEAALKRPYELISPTTFFINSMSDIFQEKVPFEFIKKIFAVMNDRRQHTFIVLTKRAERLKEVHEELTWTENIYMGVSVEDEKAMHRIDLLRETGAAIKFLSCEPLIGALPDLNLTGIDWVIAGGELRAKARPVKLEWVMDIKNKCQAAKIPFFFKQWGMKKFNPDPADPTIKKKHEHHAKGGCLVDGKLYKEMLPPLLSEVDWLPL